MTNDDPWQSTVPAFVPATLVIAGIVLMLVAFIDRTGSVPFDLPRFWYRSRTLWPILGVGLIGFGGWLLWSRRPTRTEWQTSAPPQRFSSLILYTREGCHLCDDAKDLLLVYRDYLPSIQEVDIEDDPDMKERFETCIPVVEIDGKVRFRGQVSEVLLRRMIEGGVNLSEYTEPRPT